MCQRRDLHCKELVISVGELNSIVPSLEQATLPLARSCTQSVGQWAVAVELQVLHVGLLQQTVSYGTDSRLFEIANTATWRDSLYFFLWDAVHADTNSEGTFHPSQSKGVIDNGYRTTGSLSHKALSFGPDAGICCVTIAVSRSDANAWTPHSRQKGGVCC